MERKRRSSWEQFEAMFEEMQRSFDRMFAEILDEVYITRPLMDVEQRCLEPLVDVRETHDSIIVTADLPYVNRKDNIDIRLLEKSLEIRAKTSKPICFERWGTVQRRTHFNEFRKTVKLPTDVDSEGVKATFRRGILQIVMPKKVKKTQIKVQ